MTRYFHTWTLLALALFVAAPGVASAQGLSEAQVRATFKDKVLPALRRAETDAAALDGAMSSYLGWMREAQLHGYEDDAFPAEQQAGMASLTIGLKNAYAKAKQRCPGVKPTRELFRLARMSLLLGWSEEDMLFPTFDQDVQACTPETIYRVSVRIKRSEAKRGVGRDVKYVAFLAPNTSGEPGELEGEGTYTGFIVARAHEYWEAAKQSCVSPRKPERADVRGKIDATGSIVDWSAMGGGKEAMTYAFESKDWPLKIMEDENGIYARTAQEKEDASGLGSWLRNKPVSLTKATTSLTDTRNEPGDKCSGQVTETEEIEIQRIGGSTR